MVVVIYQGWGSEMGMFFFFFSGGDTVLKFDSYLGCITLNILKCIEFYNSGHNGCYQFEMRNPCMETQAWATELADLSRVKGWTMVGRVHTSVHMGQSQRAVCGGQRCGLGLPGSAGSFGSAGDVVEASSRNLIQAALLVCCRGKRPEGGSECARWCSKRGGKYSG